LTDELGARLSLGHDAQAVLNSEAFAAAFDTLTKELQEAWQNSPVRDAAGRESLYLQIRLLEKVKINLVSLVTDGTMAQQVLASRTKMQQMADRARDWMDS